jgi:uncharacterized membrane protein YoaK (UPF0700 family)
LGAVDVKRSLRFAALLCAGGGFLDSFAWVAHGRLFVNGQTGNIILFGVFSAQDDWSQTLRRVLPMLAFFPGVFAANGCANAVFPTTRCVGRLSASASRSQS